MLNHGHILLCSGGKRPLQHNRFKILLNKLPSPVASRGRCGPPSITPAVSTELWATNGSGCLHQPTFMSHLPAPHCEGLSRQEPLPLPRQDHRRACVVLKAVPQSLAWWPQELGSGSLAGVTLPAPRRRQSSRLSEGHHTGPGRGKEPRRSNYPGPPDVDGRGLTRRTKGRGIGRGWKFRRRGAGRGQSVRVLSFAGEARSYFQTIPQG